MEQEIDFKVIAGKGYTKNLFSHLSLSPNSQVSVFGWDEGGESAWHDHDVDEVTFNFKGDLEETVIFEGKMVVTIHKEGTFFTVPAGTLHKIKALKEAITVNICDGDLHMKVYQEEELPIATVASIT